jgi:hypothetical protein
MQDERRRDRVWKYILNRFAHHDKLSLFDIDVSLTTYVDTHSEALEIVDKEDYRSEDDILKDPGGEGYIVEVEPDASIATKRYVLKTLAGDRFQLTEPTEGQEAVWTPGPHLEYLYGLRDDTPIDNPLSTEHRTSWDDVEDFEMEFERRRDRLWFNPLNLIHQQDQIDTKEVDASVTVVTESRAAAFRVIEQEAYRTEADISSRVVDGETEYLVSAEPDVSHSTKLSLLKTMAKERYGLLNDAGLYDGWHPGPWACALFNLAPQTSDPSLQPEEIAKDTMTNTTLDDNDRFHRITDIPKTDS